MKKITRLITKEELMDYPMTDLVEGWFFRVNEVSQGFYLVEGKDLLGHVVSRMGIDPDALMNACKSDIHEMFPGS